MINVKPGVRLIGLSTQIWNGVIYAHEIFDKYGQTMVITSGTEGTHSHLSYHYTGDAIDIRTNNVRDSAIIAKQIKQKLKMISPFFDVVLEETHIHIEFDRRRFNGKT